MPGTQVTTSGGFGTAHASVPCEDSAPDALAPGDSFTSCGTYMTAKDVSVMSVTHTLGGGFISPADQVTFWPVDGGLATAEKEMAAQGDTIAVRWDTGAGAGDLVPPGGRVTQRTVHLLADGDEPVGIGFEDADEGDLSVRRAHVS
ncbi:hypothetical protein ACN6K9_004936 [Streptomyces sp. SAS_267]|uniref:hypothetical protein n=1 Tax=Streptomyces sp. SAS_267 TaxID=3412750 RepID=UPI00403D3E12